VTVAEVLEARHQLDDIGGLGYLHGVAANTPSAANIAAYARIVRSRATLRTLLRTAGDDPDGPVEHVRERVAEKLSKVKERFEGSDFDERARSAGKAADAYVRENPWAAVAIAVGLGYLIGRGGGRN